MALNLKSLLPVTDHPCVTQPVLKTSARAGADQEKGVEQELSAKRRGLIAWRQSLKINKKSSKPKATKNQLLDVL